MTENESGPEQGSRATVTSLPNDYTNRKGISPLIWSDDFEGLLKFIRYADLTVGDACELQEALAYRCGVEMPRAFHEKWQGKVMFTIPEAAEFVGVAHTTIRSWIRKEILPVRKFGPSMNAVVRIHRRDLEPERR